MISGVCQPAWFTSLPALVFHIVSSSLLMDASAVQLSYFLFLLQVCVCVHLNVLRVRVCARTCVKAQDRCWCFSQSSLTSLLRWGLLLNPEVPISANPASQLALGIPSLPPVHWGYSFCVGSGDPNSGPHTGFTYRAISPALCRRDATAVSGIFSPTP